MDKLYGGKTKRKKIRHRSHTKKQSSTTHHTTKHKTKKKSMISSILNKLSPTQTQKLITDIKKIDSDKKKDKQHKTKLIKTTQAVKHTLDYGIEYINSHAHKRRHTIGGAILDDTEFTKAEDAFNYFIQHSVPMLYGGESLTGRVAEFKLKRGIKSPYTSYSRDTFTSLNVGDIRSLIVKFMIISDTATLIKLENKKYLMAVTTKELKYEYALQNYIAAKIVNTDKDNLYAMPTPYNVYSNCNHITIEQSKKYLELIHSHKETNDNLCVWSRWKEFLKLAKGQLIGIIAMTKVDGIIGDDLLKRQPHPITKYHLTEGLLDIPLSSSLPSKDIVQKSTSIEAIAGRLEKLKKTFLQRRGLQKFTYDKTDVDYLKYLLRVYSPYIAIIYTVLRIVAFTGYIHRDLHQDNYFITTKKKYSFMITDCVIIDWGDVYQVVRHERPAFLDLWEKKQFKELLDKVLKILKTFNRTNRLNNTYNTLSALYEHILGKENTGVLLQLFHNECIKSSLHYKKNIDKVWSLNKQLVSILDLETHLESVEEKLKYSAELLPSMHIHLLTQKGYNRMQKKEENKDVERIMGDQTI